jgi:flagellar P-ring protein precursor FlgI
MWLDRALIALAIMIAQPTYGDVALPHQSIQPKPKVKDLARVVRIRPNFLLGYGVVVGLRGTGDKNSAKSKQILLESLARQGVSQDINLESRNIALVAVTAELLPFACSGIRIAIKVDSIGTATDIGGGTLIATPLFGPDGKVYAVAQGPLPDGTKRTTSCRMLQGGMIENLAPSKMQDSEIYLQLSAPNASLTTSIARAINCKYNTKLAEAISPLCVKVKIPYSDTQQAMEFLSEVEEIEPETQAAISTRVIVDTQNQKIIVVGNDVEIEPMEIVYNNIKIAVGADDIDRDDSQTKATRLTQLIDTLQQDKNLGAQQIVEILRVIQERRGLTGVLIEVV